MKIRALFLIIGLIVPLLVQAGSVRQLVEHGRFQGKPIDLIADFIAGDPQRPAVLILHGFLTTKDFPTVQAMRNTAADLGLTVLTPNLSYGYPLRKGPLKCNSVHRHRLEDDIAEVAFWIDWLKRQGHHRIILIGHSSASALLLHYLQHHVQDHDDTIRGVILTSLFYLSGPELGTREEEIRRAEAMRAAGDRRPLSWHHQFCSGNYLATAESFLSYQQAFTRPKVLTALESVASRWPVHIIMGGADARYQKTGRDLLEAYRRTGANLIVIEEANHFFSHEHEFDLQDRVEELLDEMAR